MSNKDKKNLLHIINKSYWYRLYAIAFSFAGLGIFGYIYFNFIQVDILQALQEPITVLTFVIPFLPGAILAYRAERLQSKARDIINSQKNKTLS